MYKRQEVPPPPTRLKKETKKKRSERAVLSGNTRLTSAVRARKNGSALGGLVVYGHRQATGINTHSTAQVIWYMLVKETEANR